MANLKPLLSWIIGNCAMSGFEVLRMSVMQAQKLYPEFDFLIRHNNLTPEQLKFIEALNVPLFDQASRTYCIEPEKCFWLLFPGRTRLAAHEIKMDNDIIFLKRHPIIDTFLQSRDMFFASSGFSTTHCYGYYRDCVPPLGHSLNSGLYGFPPGFQAGRAMATFFRKFGLPPYKHANPQGVVAYLIKTQKNWTLISNKDIGIVRNRFRKAKYGYHFVGINGGETGAFKVFKELNMINCQSAIF